MERGTVELSTSGPLVPGRIEWDATALKFLIILIFDLQII